jgi:dynein heavy chain 2
MRLLSRKEQEELRTNDTFKPFLGLNPIQYNPYTEPLWRAAVKQFEHSLILTEERIAGKLQFQLQAVNTNTLQVFVVFFFGILLLSPIEYQNTFFLMQGQFDLLFSVFFF